MDARIPWTTAVIVAILLAGLVPIALTASGVVPPQTDSPSVAASQSPSPSPSPSNEASPTVTPPPPPSGTPEGTPAPHPSAPIDQAASASVTPPSPSPRATPTATPQPGLWRIQGYVVDENGNPLSNVCVVVGPRGCHQFSLHTDDRGHYFLDIAEPLAGVHTTFDFYFELPGHQTIWWQVTPGGPIEFNVVLKKS